MVMLDVDEVRSDRGTRDLLLIPAGRFLPSSLRDAIQEAGNLFGCLSTGQQ
jgi:hypothetical protein